MTVGVDDIDSRAVAEMRHGGSSLTVFGHVDVGVRCRTLIVGSFSGGVDGGVKEHCAFGGLFQGIGKNKECKIGVVVGPVYNRAALFAV